MMLGVVLAVFYEPSVAVVVERRAAARRGPRHVPGRVEQLRAERAARRAERSAAPGEAVPAGAVRPRAAGARVRANGCCSRPAGFGLALSLNWYFFASALWLWVMGIAYNVPPIRTKEWPYLDVLSESVNNPIRLLLGWFALVTTAFPPVSLAVSYWMVGAFFMAMKRYAEYRHIGDPKVAAAYRRSFEYYTEERLLDQPVLLRHDLRALRRHLHRPLPPRADSVRAVRGRAVRLLHEARPAAATARCRIRRSCTGSAGSSRTWSCARSLFVVLMFTSIPGLYSCSTSSLGDAPLWTLGAEAR